jgi:predicted DNA-binding transcriptional regulator AlpA
MKPETLRPSSVAARYGLSRHTIARRMRDDPDFPQPIRVSKRLAFFKCSERDAYFDGKRTSIPRRTIVSDDAGKFSASSYKHAKVAFEEGL